jgi:hypothetical protein
VNPACIPALWATHAIARLLLPNESEATIGNDGIVVDCLIESYERKFEMNDRKSSTAEQIERRAYELYLERGGGDGEGLADWLAAERELAELAQPPDSGTPKARAAAASFQATSPKVGMVTL